MNSKWLLIIALVVVAFVFFKPWLSTWAQYLGLINPKMGGKVSKGTVDFNTLTLSRGKETSTWHSSEGE